MANKQPGWLSVSGRGDTPVLSLALQEQLGVRIWPVHRLDVETSGVILFAKNAEAHRQASMWFEKRQVKKTYVSLAQGQPTRPMFQVKTPVQGSAATTQFEVLEKFAEAFYVKAIPQTGRRHQIRVHLSSVGHPVLGDVQYGGNHAVIQRVALHASRLELPGGKVFEAPLPEDFQQALEIIRQGKR